MPSFDIVSELDLQEVDNAVNQVLKEIATRFDFKSGKLVLEHESNADLKTLKKEIEKLGLYKVVG